MTPWKLPDAISAGSPHVLRLGLDYARRTRREDTKADPSEMLYPINRKAAAAELPAAPQVIRTYRRNHYFNSDLASPSSLRTTFAEFWPRRATGGRPIDPIVEQSRRRIGCRDSIPLSPLRGAAALTLCDRITQSWVGAR
ncbi:MAG TPA: hypothetical protein VLZ81_00365 [Blastocatellia bacterium]|nr:hypothetical protein [Blastocatellia bacterium]